MPTHPPVARPCTAHSSLNDKEYSVRHPITRSSVALMTHRLAASLIYLLMVLQVQQNKTLSDGGPWRRLHAARPVGDLARSCRVPGYRRHVHLRPSGPLRSSPSMARRLALPGSSSSAPFVGKHPVRPSDGAENDNPP